MSSNAPGLGVQLNANEIQVRIGTIARDVHVALERVAGGKLFMDRYTDAELASLFSISGTDAAALRLAMDALWDIHEVYVGNRENGDPAVLFDFRTQTSPVFGLGFP